jgi:hypothetical protein
MRSAILICVLWASAGRADVIGQLTDPPHSGVEAGLDIVAAQVEQTGGRLTFSLWMRGDVPTSLPDPDDVVTFLWFVDTDEDPGTGQPHGPLGSEFNVRAVIGENSGGGYVDICDSEPGGGLGVVTVEGNLVTIEIWLDQIATPADFNWLCSSFRVASGNWVSGNPETAMADAQTLPYTAPEWITVTTPILQLCPAGPATGRIEVEIRDAAGNVLPPAEHAFVFHSTNEAVATVDADGLVTAITPPAEHWQTPYIEVWADGRMADTFAVVRVTAIPLGVVHQEYAAQHVSFWLPPQIEGVDLEALTMDYEIVTATELAYLAETSGVGGIPFRGCRHNYVLDVTDDPATGVCGASGCPTRLGWQWGQPANNSCFIVNDPARRVPQWFVIWHEMGHNVTCACNAFNLFCMGPSEPHNFTYREGLASLAAMWAWQSVLTAPGSLGTLARDDIDQHFGQGYAPTFRQNLSDYQAAGANYDTIDPNIVDGIFLEVFDQYGPKAWYDLFSTFLPAEAPLPLPIDTREKQATWIVAAMSVSSGEDLRELFAGAYGFPIDEAAWPEILAAVQTRIEARPWTTVAVENESPAAPLCDRLLSCSPNPFNPRTEIRFATTGTGRATLAVHDLRGRRVATLMDAELPAGEHAVVWDGRDARGRAVAAGPYFARLTTAAGASTHKLTLVK